MQKEPPEVFSKKKSSSKMYQNLQENICVGVSFLVEL